MSTPTLSAFSSAGPSATPVVVEALPGADSLAVENGRWLLSARFDRMGPDLVATADDGRTLVVRDYFSHAPAPDLDLGGAVLRGRVVERLAGPAADGHAQAAESDVAAAGAVETVTGEAWATRVDGSRVPLQVGSLVHIGDFVETGPGGSLAIVFLDGTALSLSDNARMVIDDLVYDPGSNGNTSSLSLVEGLFVLVSGDIATSGTMTIETPVATIGIRGTSVAIQAAPEGLSNLITLLQDPDGNVGVVEVATAVASVLLSELGETTSVKSFDQSPSAIEVLSATDVEVLYRAALDTMQTLHGTVGVTPGVEGDSNAPDGDGNAPDGDGTGDGAADSPPASYADMRAVAESVQGFFAALADGLYDAPVADEGVYGSLMAVTFHGADDHGYRFGWAVDAEYTFGWAVDAESMFGWAVDVENLFGRAVDVERDTNPFRDTIPTADGRFTGDLADDPPADHATVTVIEAGNGDVFLRGAFLEIGVSGNGTLGTSTEIPGGFAARVHAGSFGLSFFFNLAGIDDLAPVSGDAFLPGDPVETFAIGFTDDSGFFTGSNNNAGGLSGIPMTFDAVNPSEEGTVVVTTGGLAGRLGVDQTIKLDGDASFFTTFVTLTNLGSGPISSLRYMRNGDPDQDVVLGGAHETFNDVLSNPDPGAGGIAAVNAQGTGGGANLLLVADQFAVNAANGFPPGNIEVRASAFGFSNTDPFDPLAFDTPADPDGAAEDIGINLVFSIGSLGAGQSVTFIWATSANAASDGDDRMMALASQEVVDGGLGDDVLYAAKDGTVETLIGGAGDDILVARSSGFGSPDVLMGGDGNDTLVGGGGRDILSGGSDGDRFLYTDSFGLFEVSTNTPYADASGTPDTITDFVAGIDRLQMLQLAFDLPLGALTNGVSFSVIADSYNGANAGVNSAHGLGRPTFVYSQADHTLFFDQNGSAAGYQAVADVAQMGATDIEVVAAA